MDEVVGYLNDGYDVSTTIANLPPSFAYYSRANIMMNSGYQIQT
jgi:hypothetical protein